MTDGADQERIDQPGPETAGQESAAARALYDLQSNIGYLLRTTNQIAVVRFNAYLTNALAIDNITTTQFAVLTSLMRFPGASFSALSKFTSIDMPTLNSMINRLSARNLLSIQVDPADKRSRQLWLTPEGMALARRLTEHGNRIGDFTFGKLSETERRRLISLLKKMGQEVETQAGS